jgi:peptidoglycan/LPS O-acetylase OafA/YrhL
MAREIPSQPETVRDSALDGWRGVAALLVVIAHLAYFRLENIGDRIYWGLTDVISLFGHLGVQLFFAISGYVITTLMLREEEQHGNFSFAGFYIRRAFRILPPLGFFMAVLLALHFAGVLYLNRPDFFNAAMFICNLQPEGCGWWVGHTWTLAYEEQFYLVWPVVFAFARRWRKVIAGLTLLGLMISIDSHAPTFLSAPVSLGSIAAGVCYALSERLRGWIARAASGWLWLLVMLALFTPAMQPLVLPVLPLLVLYAVFAGKTLEPVRMVLESRALQIAGACSYSAYLWQQLFLAKPQYWAGAPLPLWGLPIAMAVSYALFERPFIRLGRRISVAVVAGQAGSITRP